MTRGARDGRVYFFEEPIRDAALASLSLERQGGLTIAVPHLPDGLNAATETALLRALLDDLIAQEEIVAYTLWYYTPMALAFSRHLSPALIVYDCMDELSAFAQAPPALHELEAELLLRADLVFTGGQSLYEAKRHRHPSVHAFPSSVDVPHFARARSAQADPPDQAPVPRPRLGYFGVIDERMDLALLDGIAAARPGWQIVLLGPTAKIDPGTLPRRRNIHYLGQKRYQDLPSYVAGWDVALLPFARNESTRFISPTKTPEYLAAGKPVVSTSIRDVIRPYAQQGLVLIADTVDEFLGAVERSLSEESSGRQRTADALLRRMSWDGTWRQMQQLMEAAVDVAEPASISAADRSDQPFPAL